MEEGVWSDGLLLRFVNGVGMNACSRALGFVALVQELLVWTYRASESWLPCVFFNTEMLGCRLGGVRRDKDENLLYGVCLKSSTE